MYRALKKLTSLVSEIEYKESELQIEYENELAQIENQDPLYPSILGGLVFPNYQEVPLPPDKFQYKVRMTPTLAQLRTKELFPAYIPQGPTTLCKILNLQSE